MKKSIALTALASVCALPCFGQSVFSQFFNNNNGFVDAPSAGYNWSITPSAPISLVANNVSGGFVFDSSYIPLNGEETRAAGFLFAVPSTGTDAPGAIFMNTTHLGSSTVPQNAPQADWFLDGPTGPSGLTAAEVISIQTRSNAATAGVLARIALQVNGTDWLISSTTFSSENPMVVTDWTNLLTETWISGGFSGGVVDSDLSDNATTTITGTDLITGYGYYADTEALAGGSSRIRLDYISVTAVPEPATTAGFLGIAALGVVIWRRRR